MPTGKAAHPPLTIPKATEAVAPGLVAILQGNASQRFHSAIDVVWLVEKGASVPRLAVGQELGHVAVRPLPASRVTSSIA